MHDDSILFSIKFIGYLHGGGSLGIKGVDLDTVKFFPVAVCGHIKADLRFYGCLTFLIGDKHNSFSLICHKGSFKHTQAVAVLLGDSCKPCIEMAEHFSLNMHVIRRYLAVIAIKGSVKADLCRSADVMILKGESKRIGAQGLIYNRKVVSLYIVYCKAF